jgi:hypothetical protein
MESSTVLTNGQVSSEYKKRETNSEAILFLKELYKNPPKLKIIWKEVDEVGGWLKHTSKVQSKDITDYRNGLKSYKNRISSSNFYRKSLKVLTNSLEKVSVYTIVNDFGEIITANPSLVGPLLHSDPFIETAESEYDEPPLVSRNVMEKSENTLIENGRLPKLGLFFFNKDDATVYLTEIANSDPRGTTTVGLSVKCISLSSAYELTREYHSNLDFRFIPDLDEIANLLEANNSKFTFVDIKQNQLRSNEFEKNLISSFVSADKNSIKGVPIYFVQVKNVNTKNGKVIWSSNDILTHVCFEKKYALELIEKAPKSKIYVSNLEDFLEFCEEEIPFSTDLDKFPNICFWQSDGSNQILDEFLQNPKNQESYKEFLLKQFNTKFKLLSGFINAFIFKLDG